MAAKKLNNYHFRFQAFDVIYSDKLLSFLTGLSAESKSRFGPHPFTKEAILEFFEQPEKYKLYIAISPQSDEIVAYTIVYFGWISSDAVRFSSYGLNPLSGDCTLAPAVADRWQSMGIGNRFLTFVVNELQNRFEVSRIFLWGGVQRSNSRAYSFYKKHGFSLLGEFEHHGKNYDMVLKV